MSPAESFRVMLFIGAVGVVYTLAGSIAVQWVFRKRLQPAPSATRAWRWFQRVILGLAGFGLLCIGYGFWIEPYWPEVTRTRIVSPRLPPGTRPIRIVHLSDLHCDPRPRLEERLPDLVAAEKPDLIVFSGDCINAPDGLPVLKPCLTRLAKIAPLFVVRGNWDAWFWNDLDLFGGTGARELEGTAEKVDVAGAAVWVAGVGVEKEHRAGRALAAIPPGAFTIFLHHYPYPDVVPEADRARVDLFCAGHVHGGQIAMPFYGALTTLSKYGKQYEAGLYRVGPMHMYVSRGIGMEGDPAPRVRFCARPEVAVIEAAPGQIPP
jgi:predicted MPP superfamily phosphohydrolase